MNKRNQIHPTLFAQFWQESLKGGFLSTPSGPVNVIVIKMLQ